jgi:hypothetical protein
MSVLENDESTDDLYFRAQLTICPTCGEPVEFEFIPAQRERWDEPGCGDTWVCTCCGSRFDSEPSE